MVASGPLTGHLRGDTALHRLDAWTVPECVRLVGAEDWSHTQNKTSSSAKKHSAEIIAEAPSSGSGVLPLTNFGTVQFMSALAGWGCDRDAQPRPYHHGLGGPYEGKAVGPVQR
jgi:hypothetical protein